MDGWVIMDMKGDAMKTRTVREFQENAPDLLQSKDPILVTRRGRLAGVFFPWPESTLPVEFKRECFSVLSAEVEREVKQRGVSESEVSEDFESWRKARRETRHRR